MNNQHQINWVPLKRYCELTSESAHTVYCRRSAGIWIDGKQTKKVPGAGVWVNLREVEKWIETSSCL
ncbi:hypothetical protein [Cupriavidus necator]